MAKKKKTYKVSSKPKVAAMNEYIYKNIRESDFKVNRPGKPKKIYKQQLAKRTNLKVYKASPAELARSKYKGPKFSKLPGASKPMPTTVAKGFKVGDPNYTVRKPYAPPKGYVAPSQMPVKEQKILKNFKPTGAFYRETYKGKKYIKEYYEYTGKPKPKYKRGTSSPLNQKFIKQASKPMSATAKKALITRGAKVAVKGASRLIPGVGTAMLVKDVVDITKWASKQPKVKKASKIYGTQANKIYKYNR
tara:strand:+ start:644 stop:1387 length:744 start_codon:yes stop_codon:yes gene_type:complete